MPTWHTPAEVAEALRIDAKKVLRWIASGELAAVNVAARSTGERPRWRISAEALQAFQNGRQAKPPQQPAPRTRRKATAGVKQYY